MAKADDTPARSTTAQRAQQKRDQKLADVQEEIDSGRMTHRRLTPEEMEVLTLAAELVEKLGDPALTRTARDALAKIAAALPRGRSFSPGNARLSPLSRTGSKPTRSPTRKSRTSKTQRRR